MRTGRQRQLRGTLLLVLAMLLAGGVSFAVVFSLLGSNAHTSAISGEKPGWLGVDMAGFPFAGGSFPLGGGVLVADVVPGSPAAAAGLEPGDVITHIDNRPVATASDVDSALAGKHAGEHVEIQYDRGPIPYSTQATLRARPPGYP